VRLCRTEEYIPPEDLEMSKIAVVQTPPVLLDREQTIEKAVSLIGEVADAGAELVVFPETFIPGYPIWMWRLRPGADMSLTNQLYGRLFANAVDLEGDDLVPIRSAAKEHSLTVVCGMNERDGTVSRGTLYNTVVVVGADGEILNRHRKLMPTNPERMVHGFGDASGLRVVDTPVGRIGTLLCWENYMPLARYALYAQGVEIYIAPTYDSGDPWIGTLQHIAREGRCWVVGSGFVMRGSDIPDDFPQKDELYPDPDVWVNPGDSIVIGPNGKTVEGPMREETGILHAEIDTSAVGVARRALDVAGHYSRPDVFELRVNREAQRPASFK
jgi:nitrilase